MPACCECMPAVVRCKIIGIALAYIKLLISYPHGETPLLLLDSAQGLLPPHSRKGGRGLLFIYYPCSIGIVSLISSFCNFITCKYLTLSLHSSRCQMAYIQSGPQSKLHSKGLRSEEMRVSYFSDILLPMRLLPSEQGLLGSQETLPASPSTAIFTSSAVCRICPSTGLPRWGVSKFMTYSGCDISGQGR
ncbi:hypothetical protein LZ30DRAFT_206132 [Colletotrichum cereale]|nr:hypothetical protein LZ30DRAFT_206132 [Colletotrichum cereale]